MKCSLVTRKVRGHAESTVGANGSPFEERGRRSRSVVEGQQTRTYEGWTDRMLNRVADGKVESARAGRHVLNLRGGHAQTEEDRRAPNSLRRRDV